MYWGDRAAESPDHFLQLVPPTAPSPLPGGRSHNPLVFHYSSLVGRRGIQPLPPLSQWFANCKALDGSPAPYKNFNRLLVVVILAVHSSQSPRLWDYANSIPSTIILHCKYNINILITIILHVRVSTCSSIVYLHFLPPKRY